jgi:anti-sigma factor RsiW
MNDSRHVDDDLQELLDGRLSEEAQARVEVHLVTCDGCRQAWNNLRRTRDAVRGIASREVPADLVATIRAALDHEDEPAKAGPHQKEAKAGAPKYAVLASAAVAAAALILLIVYLRQPDLPETVADDHARYVEGELRLEIQSDQAETINAFLTQRVPFPPRVFDLSMMNYALLGGRVHTVAGRPSAFFVYRGEEGRIVLCQMYEGTVEELRGGGERREHNGILFHIYRRGARTVVFWQEGRVTCVLTSDIAAEDVIQLAFAKAMLPLRS